LDDWEFKASKTPPQKEERGEGEEMRGWEERMKERKKRRKGFSLNLEEKYCDLHLTNLNYVPVASTQAPQGSPKCHVCIGIKHTAEAGMFPQEATLTQAGSMCSRCWSCVTGCCTAQWRAALLAEKGMTSP
jgi:hypothetical protein